ncbi:MAG: ArsR/SmtB family transcription factor [Leptothrix ochracea]|jgi:DNA-binding transcriptional ArsR family regulator|uniref:ArsR/SmtB family transcription factor n=1 Tax=Leptothrix ochracea TaxID=735331 RepID=UPI0034E1B54C
MSRQGEQESERVFRVAADLFGLLSAPIRLRIVCVLGDAEMSVRQLLDTLAVNPPNLSQHLATLYRAGVLARRRAGSQVYYRVASDRVLLLCQAVQDELSNPP